MPLNHGHVLGHKRKRSALDLLVAGFSLVAIALLALVCNTSAAHAETLTPVRHSVRVRSGGLRAVTTSRCK